MANIQQAAKWMQQGKHVRRPWLASHISLGALRSEMFPHWIAVFDGGTRARDNRMAAFDVNDLLAEDWEVAAEAEVERKDSEK